MADCNRKLILEDGSEYYGSAFGDRSDRIFEVVFNTSMVGYQEILSDPSYTDQGVVMTYPLIGNYGTSDGDFETERPTIGGLIVREYNDFPSHCQNSAPLAEVMKKFGIPGLAGVDTRKLTRSIRDFGSRRGLLTDASTPREEGLRRLSESTPPTDAVRRVSCRTIRQLPAFEEKFHVVAVDCGMKENIARSLRARGCRLTVVPWDTPAGVIESFSPDGVFLSNGPGNPADVKPVVETVRTLCGKFPLFGICLGHQIVSLAYGASTYKLKFGHRGGNHPVKNLATGRIEITSQNHSFAVEEKSLAATRLTVTHKNLLDNTVEGVECLRDRLFSVQYHPESAPGPQDSAYLFDRFIRMMEEEKSHA